VLYLTQDPPQHGVRPSERTHEIHRKNVRQKNSRRGAHRHGHDGRDGIVDIKDCGGITISEAEETCVVYGMPAPAGKQAR